MTLIFMFAHASSAAGTSFDFMALVPFILVFFIIYVLMIRPQQKKVKEQEQMLEALKRGDKVLTTGGLIGTIHRVISETELSLEVSEELRVRIARNAVTTVLSKTEPQTASSKKADK